MLCDDGDDDDDDAQFQCVDFCSWIHFCFLQFEISNDALLIIVCVRAQMYLMVLCNKFNEFQSKKIEKEFVHFRVHCGTLIFFYREISARKYEGEGGSGDGDGEQWLDKLLSQKYLTVHFVHDDGKQI